MNKGTIFVISGPSGSGKTTLHDMLLADKDIRRHLAVTVSATTRPPRKGEKHGRDYFFLTEKMFLYKIKAGHFLEYAKVFNQYYGTLRSQVKGIWQEGKQVLLSIDVQGCRQICSRFPQAITIFVKTRSLLILQDRLQKRKTDDPKTIAVRLKTAREELKEASKYKFIIVNDELNRSYAELKKIVLTHIQEPSQ